MLNIIIGIDKMIASSYFMNKTIEHICKNIQNKSNKNDLEKQIISLLEEILIDFCKIKNYEYDINSILSTYIYNIINLKEFDSEDIQREILSNAINVEIDNEDFNLWMSLFTKHISKPEYIWVYNIIIMNNVKLNNDNYKKDVIKIFAKFETLNENIIVEDFIYFDFLKRMSFEIEDKFFVNENTICLMFDKNKEKQLIILTRYFNYSEQNEFKVRLYKLPYDD